MRVAGVTVCVPTHGGREALTIDLLDSLTPARESCSVPVEVIVVDDPGSDGRLERNCEGGAALYMRGPRSAGEKRNLAAAHASHDVLLFLDSDCRATASLIEAHVRALDAAPPDVAGVAGRTVMTGAGGRCWRTLEHSRLLNACFDFTDMYSEVAWAVTCNLSVRTEVFRQVGGFERATATRFGGEDVDLGIRVHESGYRWLTAPGAVVQHRRDPLRRLGDAAHKLFTYGRADVFLTERYPRRRVPYRNPLATAALATAAATASRIHLRAGSASLLLAYSAAHMVQAHGDATGETLYGPSAQPPARAGRRHPLRRIGGRVVDRAFDAGLVWEALRRRRPELAFVHFAYTDPSGFVRRG